MKIRIYDDEPFKVVGQDEDGQWRVTHPNGRFCAETWKTQESAQFHCDYWNGKKSTTHLNLQSNKSEQSKKENN